MTDQILMASTYRLTAVNFTTSAKILHIAFEEKGDKVAGNLQAIPFYYLISHAAELFLKCTLLKRDLSLQDLKSLRLRHSLEDLLEELLRKGVPISEPSSQLLGTLTRQHQAHALRYTSLLDDSQPAFMPQPDDLFGMLDELMMACRIATHGV